MNPMNRDELRHDLQLAINLALSCWARLDAAERDMALRLESRFENREGCVFLHWRKALLQEKANESA
jgi:hypothetical protein